MPKYIEERERRRKPRRNKQRPAIMPIKHLRDKIESVERMYSTYSGYLSDPRSWHDIPSIRETVGRLGDELQTLRAELLTRR